MDALRYAVQGRALCPSASRKAIIYRTHPNCRGFRPLRCHSGCGRAQGPPLHVQTASSQFLEAFDDVVYVWVVVIVYGILVPS